MVSVTEILDYFMEPELFAWYKREGFAKCDRISQEALRVGTIVDQHIQVDLRTGNHPIFVDGVEPEITSCMRAWFKFKHDHPMFLSTITGIQTELSDGEIMGHPDLEITEKNRWGIVDIKTSKAIQPKHWTQVAAYFKLSKLNLYTPQGFIAILRLDKTTGQYEYQEVTNPTTIQYEMEVFHAYRTAYQHGQKIREVLRQQLEQEVLE